MGPTSIPADRPDSPYVRVPSELAVATARRRSNHAWVGPLGLKPRLGHLMVCRVSKAVIVGGGVCGCSSSARPIPRRLPKLVPASTMATRTGHGEERLAPAARTPTQRGLPE